MFKLMSKRIIAILLWPYDIEIEFKLGPFYERKRLPEMTDAYALILTKCSLVINVICQIAY